MTKVTDFHTHAFPQKVAPKAIEHIRGKARLAEEEVFSDGTLPSLMASMDEAGIYRSVICSIATTPGQNESILQWSRQIRSDRIVPFPSVYPATQNVKGEVQKIADHGFKGIKLHPYYQDFHLTDPPALEIFKTATDCGLIMVLHCGLDFAFPRNDVRAAPPAVLAIHKRFPKLTLVAAHMGGWQQWESVLYSLAGTDVYLETSFSVGFGPAVMMKNIIRKHGPDRILFGTDSPWRDQNASLQQVSEIVDDPETLAKITCNNAERLLDSE
jgi:hypothetical protein